jgi:hypothetical protein
MIAFKVFARDVGSLKHRSSIVALLQLTKSVVDYVKDVKGSSNDRIRLRDSIWSTITLLEMLKFRFEDAASNDGQLPQAGPRMDVKAPLRELGKVLETLVANLAPSSEFDKAMKKVSWPFEKSEVKELLPCIEAQKSHLALAMQNNHMYAHNLHSTSRLMLINDAGL